MRHRVAGSKLGRTSSHRTAMRRNMMASLIEHERIVTTVQKAKAVKPYIEKLITLAGEANNHRRRRAFAALRNTDAVDKLFDVLGPRFKERPGGYCRVLKLSRRRLGDNGERAILEFVERSPSEEDALAAGAGASE
ncbi:MAG: 50S ribosomal protein L17 [Planctomycetes bacterium]|nr:50S ribosomal protein L17 [Planctomycetota bacterium]MDP6408634.1 50S ribosomal protein L17 [Planctomycetota bacterium]